MIVLDTGIPCRLLLANHARRRALSGGDRQGRDHDFLSRIETLQGRFATLLKAADGAQLLIGQERLDRAEGDLATFQQLPINAVAALEFDKLSRTKDSRRSAAATCSLPPSPGKPSSHVGNSQREGLPKRAGVADRELGRLVKQAEGDSATIDGRCSCRLSHNCRSPAQTPVRGIEVGMEATFLELSTCSAPRGPESSPASSPP